MKKLGRLLRMVLAFKAEAGLNMVFNILSVVFSFFSVTMILPFLGLLLGTMDMVTARPEYSFSTTFFIDLFKYHLSSAIRSSGDTNSALFMICSLVVCAFFLKNVFRYLAMFFLATIRSGVVRNLRNDLYGKVLALPLSFYTEKRKGDLLARVSNDVQEVEWSIMSSLEVLVKDPLTLLAFLAGMIAISPSLTLIVFIVLPIAGFLIGNIGKSLKRTSLKTQHQLGQLLSTFEETFSGIRIIKAFSAEHKMSTHFRKQNRRYFQLMQRMYRKRDLASPLSEFLGVTALGVIILYGGKMVLSDELGADKLITYVAFFSQLIPPAKAFTSAWYNIQRGSASLERIQGILSAEERIVEIEDPTPVRGFEKDIVYKDVGFSYDHERVLQDINLTIRKGQTVALVGPSGAGKSTMADLLPRFYDTSTGRILVDGKDVRDLRLSELRSLMGIVTQESILFNDTVFNNIALGVPHCTMEQVVEAAKVAHAHDFIMQMEKGYETSVGERGGKLSGGQRQRLSIARAVLKNPPILILDEATSALDTESEKWVQEALLALMKNRTSLVIAHRLSTIKHADRIVVLEDGRIVETGNHRELLERNGVYKKLHDLQHFA